MHERKKLTMVKAQAYLKAGKTRKSAMLDDFCESTGYCRRYAARVLHQAGQRSLLGNCILVADPTKHIHWYRPLRYGPLVQQALIIIWSASTFLGPVRLAGSMLLFVENQKGAWASPSGWRDTAAAPPDESCHDWETPCWRTKEVSSPWDLPYPEHSSGPIQTCMDPPLDIPGVLVVDLVGHDGGQAVGDFNWTLTVTDCTTGWTETGAVRTKAEVYVVAALETCLHRYPR